MDFCCYNNDPLFFHCCGESLLGCIYTSENINVIFSSEIKLFPINDFKTCSWNLLLTLIKIIFILLGQLILHRTCSEELPLNIMLNSVCKTERNGNGYLCMCEDDLCNGTTNLIGYKLTTMVVLLTLLMGLNWMLW